MAQSWYVESQCVDIKELQPVSLMIVGSIIQTLISAIILSKEEDSTSISPQNREMNVPLNPITETIQKGNMTKQITLKKKSIQWGKSLLLLWQLISVWMILIMDIIQMIDKVQEIHKGWNRYQCIAAILLTSSNAKTVLSYAFIVAMLDESINPMEIYISMGEIFLNSSMAKRIFITGCSLLGLLEIILLTPHILGVVAYLSQYW